MVVRTAPALLDSAPDHEASPRSAAAESLLARLDDPKTAAALHDLLDNAELLAMAAGMIDGLVRRSETITGNLASTLLEVKDAATGGTGELKQTATEVVALLPAAVPVVQGLLASHVLSPASIAAIDQLSLAIVEGLQTGGSDGKPGVRSLLGELRDPDTFQGLTTLLAIARALGRRPGA